MGDKVYLCVTIFKKIIVNALEFQISGGVVNWTVSGFAHQLNKLIIRHNLNENRMKQYERSEL